MTEIDLDGLLYRANTCPRTLTLKQLEAAKQGCEKTDRAVPEFLTLELVWREIRGETE